jgi:2-octaprenyl-6-methoxyphenol hydroxylase
MMQTDAIQTAQMQTDIAIVGGGLVGASLALALAQLRLSVTLFEAHPFGVSEQPSFDDRTTAISNGSRRIFEGIGLWPLLERDATPIRRIHVSDQGRFGFARIDAEEQQLAALGYVLTNRAMGAALWQRLSEAAPTDAPPTNALTVRPSMQAITTIAPARVTAIEVAGDHRLVTFEQGADSSKQSGSLAAKLVIAADGARSTVRESAGIAAQTWNYDQVAVTANIHTQKFHDHVAYERFTPSGPIAILPLSEARSGLIWTLAPEAAQAILALDDAAFLARLQQEFGFRLGRITKVGRRQTYPLSLTRADEYVAERLAVVGNAAQALHPIAGQGFNLGLRDAASLAEVLADARAQSSGTFDAGDGLHLQRYGEWRRADRTRIVGFTDGLVRLFTQPFGPVKLLRDAGLLAFDLLPAAKDALSQLSLGAAGKVPRLARGGKLSAGPQHAS